LKVSFQKKWVALKRAVWFVNPEKGFFTANPGSGREDTSPWYACPTPGTPYIGSRPVSFHNVHR
jgi:hypothetical protein